MAAKDYSTSIATVVNGNLVVDQDALRRVLNPSKIGDRPLAVISIAGKNRTGKSFMLNFFIRYLRQKGWENRYWIGDGDKKVDDGFTWRRGADPNTQGIDIWQEVFIVRNRNGSEIAVMLMDTQGLFDTGNSAETNAKVLSLSALFSSHLILNVKNLINELDLEHLQFCIEYAREAVKRGEGHEKKFQAIEFLIRDWENDCDNEFGPIGGQQYLSKCLSQDHRAPAEVMEVKRSIHQAFESIQCFLMPHPGTKIPRMDNADVSNKNLEPKFLEMLKQFTEFVLHPDNLIIKTIGGKQATASGICNLGTAVAKSFKPGQLPHIGTILENTAKAANSEALVAAGKEYKAVMARLHKTFVSESQLQSFHQIAENMAFEAFDNKAFASTIKGKYRQQLSTECMQKFERAKDRNVQMKDVLKERVRDKARSCSQKYEVDMLKIVEGGETVADSELERQENVIRKSIKDCFNTEVNATALPPADVEKFRQGLDAAMGATYARVKRENRTNRESKECLKMREEMLIYKAVCGLVDDLRKESSRYMNEVIEDDMKEMCEKTKERYLDQFDKAMAKNPHKDVVKKQRAELEEKLAEECLHLMQQNEKNKEYQKEQKDLIAKVAVQQQRHQLQEAMDGGYLTQKALLETQQLFMKQMVQAFGQREEEFMRRIESGLAHNKRVCMQENERNRDYREQELQEIPETDGPGIGIIKGIAKVVTAPIAGAAKLVGSVCSGIYNVGKSLWKLF